VLFNNNIETAKENDPFAKPKWIYNGQFAVVDIATPESYLQETKKIKGELTSLEFREINITLLESGDKIKVLSLENYRLNPKAELSKNELILFKIILNRELDKAKKSNPFEKSFEYLNLTSDTIYNKFKIDNDDFIQQLIKGTSRKKNLTTEEEHLKDIISKAKSAYKKRIERDLRKDPATEYYKIKNSALLRFGWAMTVHKSMSYKWEEVIFNIEKAGTTNENHFRWLYTGISRARKKMSLINYKPISPFDKTEFVDNNGDTKTKDFLFISDTLDIEIAKKELVELVKHKVNSDFVLNQIDIPGWNVRINFSNNSKQATLDFGFNLKCQFKFPKYINGDTDLSNKVIELISNTKENVYFDSITELWRKNEYLKLNNELSKVGFQFNQIIQTKNKDKIKIIGNNEELDLEIDYKDEGIFSFIKAKYYSNQAIWNAFLNVINQIKA